MVLSTAFQIFISFLSAREFRQNAGDLGIVIQAFSTLGNGRFFWATNPYLRFGIVSILNAHFSWVYFAVYPFYALFPSETTLFVIQAVAIALAMIPLQSLASEASGSPRKGLLVAGLYLAWAPMYAGMPNSFHLEAFLPVVFFGLVLTWYRKEYALGLVLAIVAGFILDVAPILTGLIGVMFLTYPAQAAIRTARRLSSPNLGTRGGDPPSRIRATGSHLSRVFGAVIRLRAVRAGLGLVLVSILVFYAMRYLEANFVGWLGFHGSALGINRIVGLSTGNFFVAFGQKLVFWPLMLATVGFLPLLYPRVLIVLLPWIGYTFLEAGAGWYEVSSHYVAIAAVPLYIGVALGIAVLPLGSRSGFTAPQSEGTPGRSRDSASPLGGVSQGEPAIGRSSRSVWLYAESGGFTLVLLKRRSGALTPSASALLRSGHRIERARFAKGAFVGSIVLILGVLVANVAINPLNPVTASVIASSGNPLFLGSGGPYLLTLEPSPGYGAVVRLAGQITPHASLFVEPAMYPLITGDPNAYTWDAAFNPQFVPFNNTTLPEYVLSNQATLRLFNHYVSNISRIVWANSTYGLEGWVQSSPISSVFLFERGYTGPTLNFGPITYSPINFGTGSGLSPGPAGRYASTAFNGSTIPVIASAPNRTGLMWLASEASQSLPAGNYTVLVEFHASGSSATCAAVPAKATVLTISGNVPSNSRLFAAPVAFHQISCGAWVQLSVPFTLTHPVSFIKLDGIRPAKPLPLALTVASVEIVPVGSPPS